MTNGKQTDLAAIALDIATDAVALEKQAGQPEANNLGAIFGDQSTPPVGDQNLGVAAQAIDIVEAALGIQSAPRTITINQDRPALEQPQSAADVSVADQAAAIVEGSLGLSVQNPPTPGTTATANVDGMTPLARAVNTMSRDQFEAHVKANVDSSRHALWFESYEVAHGAPVDAVALRSQLSKELETMTAAQFETAVRALPEDNQDYLRQRFNALHGING